MREEVIGNARLILGDCRELLPTVGRVDAVVTSPPYGQQRDYGKKITDWRDVVSCPLCRTPDTGSTQVLVNLGLIHRDGEVIAYWQDLIDDMRAAGWRHFGWYTWDQMSGLSGDWNGRLAPSFEFIFHFNRRAFPTNKTKPTSGGKQHGPNMKSPEGVASGKCHAGREYQPFKVPDSVIRTPRETQGGVPEAVHPARYPVRFASEMIAPFTNPGDTVVDPFSGVGTTGIACVQLGRSFIGIEIEEKYFSIACKRIEAAQRQADLFVPSAPQPETRTPDMFAEVAE